MSAVKPTAPGKKPIKAGPAPNSTAFDKALQEAINENAELLEKLSPAERGMVMRWLEETVLTGNEDNGVLASLEDIDYVRKPVCMEEYLTSHDYMGGVFTDKATESSIDVLARPWVDDLIEVFEAGTDIYEWLMTGSIGIGKTTIAALALTYTVYRLSCLRNPARYYGLPSNSMFVCQVYSITKRQVSDAGYSMVKQFIDACPYFKEEFPRSAKIETVMDFSSTTHIPLKISGGSQGFHGLGLNVFSFSMDEVNFMRQTKDSATGENVGQAYDVYNTLLKRVKSRFIRPGGTIPGIMLMMSSKNAHTSFIDSKVRSVTGRNNIQGIKGNLGGGVYLSDYALWDVKDPAKFSGKWFRVEKGDRTQRSRILLDNDVPRQGAEVIEVPEEFRRDFEEDIDKGLRDIAGQSTYNVSPLIYDNKSVYDAFRENLHHPFTQTEATLSEDDDYLLQDWLDIGKLCKVQGSKHVPRLNPGAPRYIHVDIALSGDCAGIAMGHPSGKVRVKSRNPDGTTTTVTRPHVTIDFMLRIRPPKSGEIALWKLRVFILYLRQMFNIEEVTFDGYQSADSRQLLRHEGMTTELLSVDRDDKPYLTLRSALSDRRLMYYEYGPFVTEILDLQRFMRDGSGNKWKVDHPDQSSDGGRGSKDVSDAVCGVVYQCVNHKTAIAESMSGDVIDPTGFVKTRQPDPDKPTRTSQKPALDFDKLKDNLRK